MSQNANMQTLCDQWSSQPPPCAVIAEPGEHVTSPGHQLVSGIGPKKVMWYDDRSVSVSGRPMKWSENEGWRWRKKDDQIDDFLSSFLGDIYTRESTESDRIWKCRIRGMWAMLKWKRPMTEYRIGLD